MKMQNSSNEKQLDQSALERLFYHLNSPFYMPWNERREWNPKPTLVKQPVIRREQEWPAMNFFAPKIGI